MTEYIDNYELFQIKEVFTSEEEILLFKADPQSNSQLIYLNNNKIIYKNKGNKLEFTKVIDSFSNNTLIGFNFLNQIKSILFFFKNGDIFIIPTIVLCSDIFDYYWQNILNSNDFSSFVAESFINANSSSKDLFNIGNILLCVRPNKNNSEFTNQRKIIFKNIFSLIAFKNINNPQMKQFNSIKLDSCYYSDNLILIVSWENYLCIVNLLEFTLIRLIKLSSNILNILVINEYDNYQYIIIEKEEEFTKIVIYDSEHSSSYDEIQLNFDNYCVLSKQIYNNTNVIVSFNKVMLLLDLYLQYDLEKPLLSVNLNLYSQQNIQFVLFYQKLIFLICDIDNSFQVLIIQTLYRSIESSEIMLNSVSNELSWANTDIISYLCINNGILFKKLIENKGKAKMIIFSNSLGKNSSDNDYEYQLNILTETNSIQSLCYIESSNNVIFEISYSGLNYQYFSKVLLNINPSYSSLRELELFNNCLSNRLLKKVKDILIYKLESEEYYIKLLLLYRDDITITIINDIIKQQENKKIKILFEFLVYYYSQVKSNKILTYLLYSNLFLYDINLTNEQLIMIENSLVIVNDNNHNDKSVQCKKFDFSFIKNENKSLFNLSSFSVEKLDYSIVSNSINENLISSLKEVTKHEVKSNLLCKVNKYVEEEGNIRIFYLNDSIKLLTCLYFNQDFINTIRNSTKNEIKLNISSFSLQDISFLNYIPLENRIILSMLSIITSIDNELIFLSFYKQIFLYNIQHIKLNPIKLELVINISIDLFIKISKNNTIYAEDIMLLSPLLSNSLSNKYSINNENTYIEKVKLFSYEIKKIKSNNKNKKIDVCLESLYIIFIIYVFNNFSSIDILVYIKDDVDLDYLSTIIQDNILFKFLFTKEYYLIESIIQTNKEKINSFYLFDTLKCCINKASSKEVSKESILLLINKEEKLSHSKKTNFINAVKDYI